MKIAIIGLGGVGGYLGAHLAHHYKNTDTNIYFFARGSHAEAIRKDGLKLIHTEGEIIAHPTAVIEPQEEAPKMDYVFVCVKSYAIGALKERLSQITIPRTIIIPFMNGVNGREELMNILPQNEILDGCVFIMSHIEKSGVIVENGIKGKLNYFYGSTTASKSTLESLQAILSPALNYIHLVGDIEQRVWDKFSYISSLSTLQTYYNITSESVITQHKEEFTTLIKEFQSVAKAMGKPISNDIIEKNVKFISATPAGMTTSMQRDYYHSTTSELEGQTGYVVRKGKELSVPTPLYSMMYEKLLTCSTKKQ